MNGKCQFGKGGVKVLQGKLQSNFLLTNKQIEKLTPNQLCRLNEECKNSTIMPPMPMSKTPAKNGKLYYYDKTAGLTPDDFILLLEPTNESMSEEEVKKSLRRILTKRKIPIESVPDKNSIKSIKTTIIDSLVNDNIQEPIEVPFNISKKTTIQRLNESASAGIPTQIVEGDENLNNLGPNLNQNNGNRNRLQNNGNRNRIQNNGNQNRPQNNGNRNRLQNNGNRNRLQNNGNKVKTLRQQVIEANEKRKEEIQRKLGATAPAAQAAAPAAQATAQATVPAAQATVPAAQAAAQAAAKKPTASTNSKKNNKNKLEEQVNKTYGLIATGLMPSLLLDYFDKNPNDAAMFSDINGLLTSAFIDVKIKLDATVAPTRTATRKERQEILEIQQMYKNTNNSQKPLDFKIFRFDVYKNNLMQILKNYTLQDHEKLQVIINELRELNDKQKETLANTMRIKLVNASTFSNLLTRYSPFATSITSEELLSIMYSELNKNATTEQKSKKLQELIQQFEIENNNGRNSFIPPLAIDAIKKLKTSKIDTNTQQRTYIEQVKSLLKQGEVFSKHEDRLLLRARLLELTGYSPNSGNQIQQLQNLKKTLESLQTRQEK